VAEIVRVASVIRRSVLDTSRYPLFAARDRLVRLVVEGKMKEDDPLWRDTYGGVNEFLDQSSRVGLVSLCHSHLRLLLRMATRPELRRQFEAYRARLDEAAQQSPDFGNAMEAANKAVWEMCRRRSPLWALPSYLLGLEVLANGLRVMGLGLKELALCLRVAGGRENLSPLLAFRHHLAT
jgi:hypothetical protein